MDPNEHTDMQVIPQMPPKGLPQAAFPITRQQVFSLQHQAVRDLAWSIWGHNLFALGGSDKTNLPGSAMPEEISQPDWPWLQQIDQHPETLNEYLKTRNNRLLGSYFENLWQFYFSHHPLFIRNYFNLQIQDKQRTLGELDVLTEIQTGRHYHLELSCKFYLYHPPQKLWLGPQGNDRLDIKFEHSYQHQLNMSTSEHAHSAIRDKTPWQAATDFSPFAIWRGCLFSPRNSKFDTSPPRWRGHWYHCSEFVESALFKDNHWQLLDKKLWLSPHLCEHPLTSNEALAQYIRQHFPDNHYALMLARMEYQSDKQQWWEIERIMLVADDWPKDHKADSALIPARPCNPPV